MKNVSDLLDELYKYTQKESSGETLTDDEQQRYLYIVDACHRYNVEIPFGIEV